MNFLLESLCYLMYIVSGDGLPHTPLMTDCWEMVAEWGQFTSRDGTLYTQLIAWGDVPEARLSVPAHTNSSY